MAGGLMGIKMRTGLARLVTGAGLVAGLAAAILWGAYIWQFDWGPFPTRRWELLALGLFFGAIIIFAIVSAVFRWFSSLISSD